MSVSRYASFKDSGVEWLGEVPSHWKILSLKRMVTLVTQRAEGRTNPIALENIESWTGRLIETTTEFQADGISFQAGDVLFGKLRPYLAKVLPVKRDGEAVGDLFVLRPSACTETRYLFYHLVSRDMIDLIDGSTYGAKMPRASWDFMATLRLCVPPLPEQTAIATFLDRETSKIDELINEQTWLIELLKEKRQAVISHAVTKGLNPSAPMKDSCVEWLGKVPAHWKIQPLKHVAQFRSGGTPSKDRTELWGGSIPWASAKDLKSDTLYDTIDHLTDEAVQSGAAAMIEAGTVVVLVRGMMLARAFPVCIAGVPMTINQDLKALSGGSGMCNRYLAWLLRGLEEETLNRLDEAGHGTKALRMDAWTTMKVCEPPTDEQAEIANYIEATTRNLDELVSSGETLIALLQERRAALISAAVTGKIDVRGLVLAGAEAA